MSSLEGISDQPQDTPAGVHELKARETELHGGIFYYNMVLLGRLRSAIWNRKTRDQVASVGAVALYADPKERSQSPV